MGQPVNPQSPQPQAILAAIADLAPVVVPGATIDEANDRLVVALANDRRASVSLSGLVDACGAVDHTRWPRMIADWLGDVIDRVGTPTRAATADDLRVRLVPTPDAPPEGVVARQYGPHFQLQLMADLPDRRVWITEANAGALGLSSADALSTGLRNTIAKVLVGLDVRQHVLPDGSEVSLAAADGVPWVSTGLTSIPQLFRAPQLPFGAIVAVPRLSAVIFHEVRSTATLDAARLLGRLAVDMHHSADDPCSPTLWWFHDGAFQPIGLDGNSVALDGSLQELVARLPPRPA